MAIFALSWLVPLAVLAAGVEGYVPGWLYFLAVHLLTTSVLLMTRTGMQGRPVCLAVLPLFNMVLVYRGADERRSLLWLFAPYGPMSVWSLGWLLENSGGH